jgi:hypothetical protein
MTQSVGSFGKEPEAAGTAKSGKSNALSIYRQTQHALPVVAVVPLVSAKSIRRKNSKRRTIVDNFFNA